MAVPREETQEKLSKLGMATLAHTPSQTYTVADRLEERAVDRADHPFIVFRDRRLSYGEVNEAVNRRARVLGDLGVGEGDVVALLMENRPEFVISWMAMAKLGATASLLNHNLRGAPVEHALSTNDARLLVAGSECAAALVGVDFGATSVEVVAVEIEPGTNFADVSIAGKVVDLAALAVGQDDSNLDPSIRGSLRGENDLFHIFTSGTTGLPKAARLSHMRFLGVGDGMSAIAGYGPDDVIFCVLPLYHGAGGMVVVSSVLAQGATMALARKFSASKFFDDVRRYGVTGCQYIGEMCRYLLNRPPRADDADHSLRVLMGAGLGPEIWEEFQQRFGVERILEGWSSTEANTSLINLDNVPGSCGRIPYPDFHNGRLVRYDVATDEHPRDEAGRYIPCEVGEVGEFIGAIPDLPDSGAGKFEGYTSEEATKRKILRDVFVDGDLWYRSGDLLRRDEDDYFYFVDRIGDTYRWKSENISTQEVAEALGGFPGLEVANVYGVKIPRTDGRGGMAALVLADKTAFDGAAFFAWTEERLPAYAVPFFVRLSDGADMTSTFKLRKVDLQRDGYDPSAFGDPLFVRVAARKAYVPFSAEALAEAGFPPFERED